MAIARAMADLTRIIDALATEPASADALTQASRRAILSLDQQSALDSQLLRRATKLLARESIDGSPLIAIFQAIRSVL